MAKLFFGRRVQRLKHYAGFLLILASLFVTSVTFFGCTRNDIGVQAPLEGVLDPAANKLLFLGGTYV
jgi:hypothetical protein